jgi:hypothetical protein
MVCHLDILQDGSVGLHIGARGGVTAAEYKRDLDYRISFIGEGWNNFFQIEHLHTGKAILITARQCRHLQLMSVIKIINDLASSRSKSESDLDSE